MSENLIILHRLYRDQVKHEFHTHDFCEFTTALTGLCVNEGDGDGGES